MARFMRRPLLFQCFADRGLGGPIRLNPVAITRVIITATAVALSHVVEPAAAERVDLALVLAADVSVSIDEEEYRLQRQGYAAALTSPKVLSAIEAGQNGAIAVSFIEWSGDRQQRVVVDWAVMRDPQTATVFAAKILAAPRSFTGGTSIGAAINFAVQMFENAGFAAKRRMIDISGDGTSTGLRSLPIARAAAVAAGITINGLAIINDRIGAADKHTHPPEGLPEYYRRNVIGGPNAFVEVVRDFNSFADAMVSKVTTEIASMTLGQRPKPGAGVEGISLYSQELSSRSWILGSTVAHVFVTFQ